MHRPTVLSMLHSIMLKRRSVTTMPRRNMCAFYGARILARVALHPWYYVSVERRNLENRSGRKAKEGENNV